MTDTRNLGLSLRANTLWWVSASLAAVCLPGLAAAQTPARFTAVATGNQVIPPVATPAIGVAVLDVNAQETAMRDIVAAARLTAGTAASIHCALAGANGPVGVTLYSGSPVSIPDSGVFDLGFVLAPDADNECGWADVSDVVSAMFASAAYLNIQTLANPSGEVRGQILPPSNPGADCGDPPLLAPGADLRNCTLSDTNLSNLHLEGAILVGADLSASLLEGSWLDGADLRAANLFNADMLETEMPGADLRYADLRNILFEAGDAGNANLSWANLEGSDLFFAHFDGAILNGANLTNALISFIKMQGADLRNANLTGAFAANPDFRDVLWGNTTCPDGTNSDLDDGDNFTCESNLSPI